jgi:hypothetical protein
VKIKSQKFNQLILLDTPYAPTVGGFARTQKIIGERHKVDHWYYCREIFHNILYNLRLIFFCHNTGKGAAVAAFIGKIEEAIDVQPRSEFGPTQMKKMMWIKPSPWWTKIGMHRSLFTILLRASLKYVPSKDNFEEAVSSDKYLKETPYAFSRFMSGHTKYTGRKRGWHKQFCIMAQSCEEIDKLLIKPKISEKN